MASPPWYKLALAVSKVALPSSVQGLDKETAMLVDTYQDCPDPVSLERFITLEQLLHTESYKQSEKAGEASDMGGAGPEQLAEMTEEEHDESVPEDSSSYGDEIYEVYFEADPDEFDYHGDELDDDEECEYEVDWKSRHKKMRYGGKVLTEIAEAKKERRRVRELRNKQTDLLKRVKTRRAL